MKSPDLPLISSIEVLKKSGISRATLNNYIKLGLISPPRVLKPDSSGIKAKRVGYFPSNILNVLGYIRQMKRQRIPLDAIASALRNGGAEPPEEMPSPQATLPFAATTEEPPVLPTPPLETQAHPRFTWVALAGSISNLGRFRDEQIARVYGGILSSLWESIGKILRDHEGTIGRGGENGFLAYFCGSHEKTPMFQALTCAEALRGVNAAGEGPAINLGLAAGQEPLQRIAVPGLPIAAFASDAGGDIAEMLARRIARNGECWATRDFLLALGPGTPIRFGLPAGRRNDIPEENAFARLSDLADAGADLLPPIPVAAILA